MAHDDSHSVSLLLNHALPQANAFYWADPVLADLMIAVVDDWNYEPVQTGTAEAFEALGYEVLEGHVLGAGRENVQLGSWHNGLYVAVVRKRREKC